MFAPKIEPLLQQFHVDLALYGHLHNYERSWPVFNGTVMAQSYANPKATTHVVVGMAGDDEGLSHTFMKPSPSWSAVRRAELGYARLAFKSATEMRFDLVLAADGTVADSFLITKSTTASA